MGEREGERWQGLPNPPETVLFSLEKVGWQKGLGHEGPTPTLVGAPGVSRVWQRGGGLSPVLAPTQLQCVSPTHT